MISDRTIALIGVVGLCLASLLAVGLREGGAKPEADVVMIVIGFFLVPVAVGLWRTPWRMVIGMLVMLFTPLAIINFQDMSLFRRIAEGPIAAMAVDRSAAGHRLTDALPRLDLSAGTVITKPTRGGGSIAFPYVAAPLVGPDWAPGDPVPTWVFSETGDAPATWSAPGGIVRVVPTVDGRGAIARAAAHHGLRSAPDAVVGRWVSDPGAEQVEQRIGVAGILGGALALWLLLSLGKRRRP